MWAELYKIKLRKWKAAGPYRLPSGFLRTCGEPLITATRQLSTSNTAALEATWSVADFPPCLRGLPLLYSVSQVNRMRNQYKRVSRDPCHC